MLINFLSLFYSATNLNDFDITSLLVLIKYTSYVGLISLAWYLRDEIKEKTLFLIYNSQVLFFILVGSYVLFNTLVFPQTLIFLSGSYTQEYRLIGFTGHSFGVTGIKEIGTTSVSMGVYIALIALISLSLFRFRGGYVNFTIFISLFICLLLTYSRSGCWLFSPACSFILSNFKIKRIFFSICLLLLTLVPIVHFFQLYELLGNIGTIGKLCNTRYGN